MANKINLNAKEQELYNELKKLSKRANQRLVRLERIYGREAWAAKKLRNRLEQEKVDTWTKTGRVKLNKKLSILQMRATIKATEQFLNSQTSTVSGIKKQKKASIKGIAKALAVDDVPLTDAEAETLYDMFKDTDFTYFVPRYLTASEFWASIEDAKHGKITNKTDFIKEMENYITVGNDEETRSRLSVIYDKYCQRR